jgi:hypothetical protein
MDRLLVMTLVPTIEHPHPSGTNPPLPPPQGLLCLHDTCPSSTAVAAEPNARDQVVLHVKGQAPQPGLGTPSNVRQRTVAKAPVTRSTPPLLRRRPTRQAEPNADGGVDGDIAAFCIRDPTGGIGNVDHSGWRW